MTEQEVMQILTDMGLHEGGMDNWVPDNAWYRFANVVDAAARADEREACAKVCEKFGYDHYHGVITDQIETAIRTRGTT